MADLNRQTREKPYTWRMTYLTVEVDIENGRIIAREPGKLPEKASGLLTILPAASAKADVEPLRQRVELPLIRGDGKHLINPTPEELGCQLLE
jgi:hypothetical protein